MTEEERTELIEQAMELVREARDLVVSAVEGTSIKANFDAYGQYGFMQLLGEGNPYDSSLNSLLNEEK